MHPVILNEPLQTWAVLIAAAATFLTAVARVIWAARRRP